MRIGRPILVAATLGSFVACLLLAASRPIHVGPNLTGGNLIPDAMGLTENDRCRL